VSAWVAAVVIFGLFLLFFSSVVFFAYTRIAALRDARCGMGEAGRTNHLTTSRHLIVEIFKKIMVCSLVD
jgi:hypothetical protein